MAVSCFKINDDLNDDCSVFSGNFDFEEQGIILNHIDLNTVTRDTNNPTIVTNLTKDGGTKGYTVTFRETKPMNDLSETTEEKSFGKTYKVEGELIVYGRDPDAAYKKFLLDKSKIVLILKRAAKVGTSSYRIVLGLESGLKPVAGDTFNKDKGGYVFKFSEDFVSYPQSFIWAGSEAATAAIEADLLV